MSPRRSSVLIVLLALVAGIAAWVGGNVIRYGGLQAGLLHLVIDSPLLRSFVTRDEISSGTRPAGESSAVGARVPEVTLPDTRGAMHALSEWSGKRLVVNFWATWCAPCLEEMPYFARLQAEQAESSLQVVGIALDDPASVIAWIAAHPVNYPILLAGQLDDNLSTRFGNQLKLLPYTVVIGTDGTIARQHMGAFDDVTELRDWVLGSEWPQR